MMGGCGDLNDALLRLTHPTYDGAKFLEVFCEFWG